MSYSFSEQLQAGKNAEHYLDRWLVRTHHLWPATDQEESIGIDRWARHLLSGQRYSLQYKADQKALSTGNAFVETCSVRRNQCCEVKGWAYTCTANWLLYWVVGGSLFFVRPDLLAHQVTNWLNLHPLRRVPNDGYETEGLLIPLPEFERIARMVVREFGI